MSRFLRPFGAYNAVAARQAPKNENAQQGLGLRSSKTYGSTFGAAKKRTALGDLSNATYQQPISRKAAAHKPMQVKQQIKPAAAAGGISRFGRFKSQKSLKESAGITKPPTRTTAPALTKEVQIVPDVVETAQPVKRRTVDSFVETIGRAHIAKCDKNDLDDTQAVIEYVQDIYEYISRDETKYQAHSKYISKQPQINEKMRAILVDWLIEVHLRFKLRSDTLYLTVNYLDRYLSKKLCARTKLQLLGITCMLVASKYEEIWAPLIRDFVYICDKTYTRQEILNYEKQILSVLDFNLTVSTPLLFARRFAKITQADSETNMLVKYLMELMLTDLQFLDIPASIQAAAATYYARECTRQVPWTEALEVQSGYGKEDIMHCVKMLKKYAIAAKGSNLQAAYKKYSKTAFMQVTELVPN